MSKTLKELERQAIAAHHRGEPWREYYRLYGAHFRALEPWDRDRYHKLVDRLLHLVVCGDDSGMEPAGDGLEPWEADDAKPHDTRTQARLQLRF